MNNISAILILLLFTGPVITDPNRERAHITAKIENQTLVVTLKNDGDADLVFWKPGNLWGDSSFYLVLQNRESKKYVVCRYGHAMYLRNRPETQLVPKGSEVKFRIELNDRAWSDHEKILDERYQIVSVYVSAGISEKSISNGVFTGCMYYRFRNK